ncbi:FG-GAP repeat domain-containing protein [Glycomyces niveus]|uniref:VCBS repeat-containing protein n=1 Tax=Glycomyces niveus TaxID=2820287 RepID=A0ABS3U6B2_9ACTN|nr:VCBS repeat-containing protein [Glycomyces sp. NEAU-S30]MBO3734288.1 VCBS repeat-containing protein [Glycomyces sp. NEAU-S30]
MNRIPSRGRLLRRVAAATATAVGAALLAAPAAQAQNTTSVDCAALGDNPIAAGLEAALEAAVSCGVEVRLESEATPYSTVYVTPQGQTRFIGTMDPTQDHGDHGTADTTLVDTGGVLSQAATPWPVELSHTDTGLPLLTAEAARVDWSGDQPVPSFSGSTAEYGELAPGLSLSVEAGVAASALRFTVADAEAWSSLVSGLTVTSDLGTYGYLPGVAAVATSFKAPETKVAGLTPFKVVDADGTVAAARLKVPNAAYEGGGYGGALTVFQPSTPLEELSFPLSVTTEWIFMNRQVSEWGGVTSATPKVPLYRGDAGLDEPYFEAAGANANQVVGAYCDQLVDPDCATTFEAAAYWTFEAPQAFLMNPSDTTWLTHRVVSATFSVDAAEGSPCIAPDLYRMAESETYHAGNSWSYRETAGTLADTGECHGNTAVYDVTDDLPHAYNIDFAMLGSAETARFDGGSARIEIVRDIQNFALAMNVCDSNGTPHSGTDTTSAWQSSSTIRNGDFKAWLWRPDLIDTDLTWTATLRNQSTGTVIATSEPALAVNGSNRGTAHEGSNDGRYSIDYSFASERLGYTRNATCHVGVDQSPPEIVAYTVTGARTVGNEVSVEVEVADESYPGDGRSLTVFCSGTKACDSRYKGLHDTTVAVFEVELAYSSNWITLRVQDQAGNTSVSESIYVQAVDTGTDYNGDDRPDLMAVKESDGTLRYYAGKGDGTFATPVSLGSGWGRMDVVMAGDLTGDDKVDLLARDTKTGTLYTYPGNGSGGLGARITVGTGWNAMGVFTSGGDYNADGDIDLLTVNKSDGKLYFYDGQGDGNFNPRIAIGTGWGVMDTLASVDDLNQDDKADLLAHDSRTGQYYLYNGTGTGGLGSRTPVPASLDGSGSDRYSQIIAAGDQDGDGKEDLFAVDSRTGELELHSLNGTGTPVHEGTVVATGWGGNRLAAVNEQRTYDYNGDNATDFVARRNSDGTAYLYPGNGSGAHGTRVSWGTALKGMTLIATAGDMNGDGFDDVLARTSGGTLYLYPGTGSGALNTAGRITIGTGWNAMSTIAGGQDYNSDGKADALAVQSSNGTLYLYPGKGDGTFGSRVSLGAGWNAMKEVTAVGDLDHDGHADALAVRSSDGCLYFYGGTGSGTFKTKVKVGCGWAAMDAITGVGDFNRDGHVDWAARRKSDGSLFLYPGNGAGNHTASKLVGTGWNSMTIA